MSIFIALLSVLFATAISVIISPLIHPSEGVDHRFFIAAIAALSGILSLVINSLIKKLLSGKSQSNRASKPVAGPKRTGTIKWFNTKKQYGFITTDEGDDIFIHKRFISGDKRQRVREGMRVEFAVSETDKGLQAEDVNILE